jgi:hypothetical protein
LLDGHGHQAWITEHLDGREDKYSKVEESFWITLIKRTATGWLESDEDCTGFGTTSSLACEFSDGSKREAIGEGQSSLVCGEKLSTNGCLYRSGSARKGDSVLIGVQGEGGNTVSRVNLYVYG